MRKKLFGFTMVEILVVISIISILAGVIYASFGDARAASRDKVRKTSLKELALAIELFKAQYGFYPAEGCGNGYPELTNDDTPDSAGKVWDGLALWTGPGPSSDANINECTEYIVGLVPDYMAELPLDPNQESDDSKGFVYRVSSAGDRYKVMVLDSVETDFVEDFANEFARCPAAISGSPCQSGSPEKATYAIYSPGAEAW